MITVKFFGLIRVDTNIDKLTVDEGTVNQVINEVIRRYPSIRREQLMQAVMFVNKKQINGNRRFSIMLKEGDELALLSPISGG